MILTENNEPVDETIPLQDYSRPQPNHGNPDVYSDQEAETHDGCPDVQEGSV
jgi:hypothetical protein